MLVELAAATGLPVGFFARDPAIGDVVSVEGFFRSLRSTGVRQRRQHRAQAELVRLMAMALERYVKLPQIDVPRIPLQPGSSRAEAEAAAVQVRAEWNLPEGPVTHMVRCIYFNGHGTTQALTVLLIYFGVAAVILGVLDWLRSEPPVPTDAVEAAAMAVPIGATP